MSATLMTNSYSGGYFTPQKKPSLLGVLLPQYPRDITTSDAPGGGEGTNSESLRATFFK